MFTGDTIFSECQTWLMTSNVDQWLEALERIRALDVDRLVPGHGPVQTLDYVERQRAVLLAWKAAVADAVAKGWSREETIARVRFDDAFGPVDVGQGYMMDHIQTKQRRLALGQAHRHGLRQGPLGAAGRRSHGAALTSTERLGPGRPPIGRPTGRDLASEETSASARFVRR